MKQADVINSVVNEMLKTEIKVIDGVEVVISRQISEREAFCLIEREYRLHGKSFNFDPTRMIERIMKQVKKYS